MEVDQRFPEPLFDDIDNGDVAFITSPTTSLFDDIGNGDNAFAISTSRDDRLCDISTSTK